MNTPRNITQAMNAGYIVKRINYKASSKVLIILEPRFYNHGMKAQLSYWISRNYAKRIMGEYQWLAF